MMKTIGEPEVLDSLIERLGRLEETTQRRWGTLTAGEMLCHLADAAQALLDGREAAEARPRPLRRWLFLYLPLPWPRSVKTRPQLDPKLAGTKPKELDRDRDRAIATLRALAAAETLPSAHRLFGSLTVRDWHRWAYRHTDHHLRQFGL